MADSAAHLVDRVLPIVPYRQWVLSLPIPVRLLLLRQPKLVTPTLRIFVRRIFAWQRRIARSMGIADGRCAAVTFIQRAGGALNANPHFHNVAADGVFDVRPDGSVRFVPVLGPSDEEVEAICGQVARRVLRLVSREEEALYEDDTPEEDALTPTLPLALPPGPTAYPHPEWEHPEKPARPKNPRCAQVEGFSLHAQTAVQALDRAGLERLCRYGLRSSFALSRLSEREDGRLTYRLKRPWPDGRTELVLEPLELMRRLAHLIPPARSHLVRYHGGFAPASSIRSAIRPRLLREPERCVSHDPAGRPATRRAEADRGAVGDEGTIGDELTNDATPADSLLANPTLAHVDPELLLTVLGEPADEASLLPVRQRRLDWASLLRRVFQIDILQCPRCQGRLTVLAAINDPSVAQKILRHLGLPTDGPRCAPARAPPELELDLDGDTDLDLHPEAGFEGDFEPDDGFDPDADVEPDFAD